MPKRKLEESSSHPLLIAAENGHLEAVTQLINQGAYVDQPRTDGATPLFLAVENGHLDVVQYLISQGAYAVSYTHLRAHET